MHNSFRPGTEVVRRADVVFAFLFQTVLAAFSILVLLML
jgi:hypothetical protein